MNKMIHWPAKNYKPASRKANRQMSKKSKTDIQFLNSCYYNCSKCDNKEKNNRIASPLPGTESHASFVSSNVATIPKADGLKICFLLNLKIYFEATDKNAPSKLIYQRLVFNNRQRLMALIRTLKPHR